MSFQLNIQQFKCFARFGLMHIVATNICVWIRTVFKVDFEKSTKAITSRHFQEGIKDIAAYRVARGEGVSEDFMIKGNSKSCNLWQLFHKPLGEVFGKLCLLTLFVCLSISRGRRNKIKDFSSLSSKKQHFFVLHIKVFSLLYIFIATEYWHSYLISRNYMKTNCELVFQLRLFPEGYSILRQRFGNDSFWLHGPYHYIMKAIFQV